MCKRRHASDLATESAGLANKENIEKEHDEIENSNRNLPDSIDKVGPYDPAEFENLPVGSDVKDIFQFIAAYEGQVIETKFHLAPFLPDLIPAVCEPDAFLKVSRPDNADDELGLVVLDEPAANQSDPVILDIQLRTLSKKPASATSSVMKKLPRADKNPNEIENWIKSINELHKSKPPTVVQYSKPMPDVEKLMQEWPAEFESIINQTGGVPSAVDCSEIGLTVEQYTDLICALLDIPVPKSRVESLHVLFTLYLNFKNSPHFRRLAIGKPNVEAATSPAGRKVDTLIL
uniref:Intraflagellar transport protein 46 homolog n=1 Tax=Romanomermis culicivorax TaxID=13658 RepID=A0A915JIJ8_ROMCU